MVAACCSLSWWSTQGTMRQGQLGQGADKEGSEMLEILRDTWRNVKGRGGVLRWWWW